jgi:hypothetical protein
VLFRSTGVFVSGLTLGGITVSVSGHTHSSSDITNFNSSVSGLLPTITNSGDNKILTSNGTTTGIDAESNLAFDGSLLSISGNLIANTGTLDIIQFNTNNGSVGSQGQIGWNSTEGTVDIALTNSTVMEIGQHRFFRARNTTGSPLYKGQVVYASGVHANGIITPNLYIANNTIDEIRFIGLVWDTINHNNNGYIIDFGHLRNLDLDGSATNYAVGDETWNDGDILYAHPTVAGKLTKVKPKHAISLAIILDNANNGQLFVRPTNFGDLSYNHDVNISGVTNGQFLQYNSVTDYWVPSSSGNFTSLQVNGTGVSVSGHTHTSSNITDFNSSVSGLLPVKNISSGSGINVVSTTGNYTVSVSGLNSSYISDFNEAVDDRIGNGLFVAGTGVNLNYNDNGNSFTVSVSGIINNPTNNRILTSRDNTTTGIDAETNLTFDGSGLVGNATAKFNQLIPQVSGLGNVGGTVNTNATAAQIFDMTLTDNITLANPTNSVDGVTVRWRIKQDGGGNRGVTLGDKFQIPSSATSPLSFSTSSNATDLLAATYDLNRDKWDIIAFVPGY